MTATQINQAGERAKARFPFTKHPARVAGLLRNIETVRSGGTVLPAPDHDAAVRAARMNEARLAAAIRAADRQEERRNQSGANDLLPYWAVQAQWSRAIG